jgi:predicted DNA-binding transcriptional regulator AlpA
MGKLLTVNEAATYLHVTKWTLQKWRTEGTGPRYIKGHRFIYYDEVDIIKWVDKRKVSSTAEASNPRARARQRHHVA